MKTGWWDPLPQRLWGQPLTTCLSQHLWARHCSWDTKTALGELMFNAGTQTRNKYTSDSPQQVTPGKFQQSVAPGGARSDALWGHLPGRLRLQDAGAPSSAPLPQASPVSADQPRRPVPRAGLLSCPWGVSRPQGDPSSGATLCCSWARSVTPTPWPVVC